MNKVNSSFDQTEEYWKHYSALGCVTLLDDKLLVGE